jgi:hypothetical protein
MKKKRATEAVAFIVPFAIQVMGFVVTLSNINGDWRLSYYTAVS